MIRNHKELRFFIKADMMMNRGKFKWAFKDRIKHLFSPDYIMSYLKSLRWCQYSATNTIKSTVIYLPAILFHQYRVRKLGVKLGFSIGYQSLGYGVVIPHYGTIIIGQSNRIGNYAVLHACTCISDNGKAIGNALYLSTGAKITSKLKLGDNISIGANSVVNKSFESDIMIGGTPARYIKDADPWYVRDGQPYIDKVNCVEKLKHELNL